MSEPIIRRSKILIADDEPRNIRMLQVRLRLEGYDVIMAEDGIEAMQKIVDQKPDLILLDVMMPGKTGYEVCEELRAHEDTRFIPVIMVTALDQQEAKIKGLEAGADDFITKPPDSVELITRVRSLLRIKHFQDDLTRLNSELEFRNELMAQDLRMAREVQQQLLPQDVSSIPGFNVVYRYIPESQVGGDFVEISLLSENHLGIFLADAMGHGAQAALVTVLLKTVLSEILGTTQRPDQILNYLNNRFVKLLSGKIITYASGCYLIIDREQRRLVYSNAGHPFPLLLNRQTGECVELDGAGNGTGLGLLPHARYLVADHPFDENHTLLLFTDGIYEAMDMDGMMYGVERVRKRMIEQRDHELDGFIPILLADVENFVGGVPLPDDITVVGVELG